MNNKITVKLKEAMDSLDKVADTYGVARSMHITQAAGALIEVNREVAALMKELEELRKFKEERTECAKEENPPMRRSLCYVPEEHTECAKEVKEAV